MHRKYFCRKLRFYIKYKIYFINYVEIYVLIGLKMLGAFLLGFADGTINTNLIAMIGNLYNPKNIQNIKIDKNDNFWKCLIFISGLCYPGERESAGAFVLWNLVQVNNIFSVLTTPQFHTRTTPFQRPSVQQTFQFLVSNWRFFGVELKFVLTWEFFVLNWRILRTEKEWPFCVERRGVWNRGVPSVLGTRRWTYFNISLLFYFLSIKF